MRRVSGFIWIAAVAVAALGGPARLAPAAANERGSRQDIAQGVQSSPEELRFVELANRERATRRLGRLTIDPLLIAVARDHSREMMQKSYFDHVSPTPGKKTPMDRYLAALGSRPDYACVGENLFYCSVVDVERGHQALMHSPAHRDNLLYNRYEKIGVGIQKNAKGEFWVTQLFLSSRAR